MCVHLFSASHAERLIKSAVVVAKVRTSFTTLPFMTILRHAATVSLCTSRPQHRGYKTSIGSLLTRRRRGVPAKRTLRVVLRGQCTARGDRLRCSRDPGSNYPTGLTAPKTNRPQCRQRRRSLPQRFIRCRSATPVGNYPELAASQHANSRVHGSGCASANGNLLIDRGPSHGRVVGSLLRSGLVHQRTQPSHGVAPRTITPLMPSAHPARH